MKVKQILIILTILIFCSVFSYTLSVIAQTDEPPQWSNLKPDPQTVFTTLDDVTINVTWYDNQTLDTIIIWENSTGNWISHDVSGQ